MDLGILGGKEERIKREEGEESRRNGGQEGRKIRIPEGLGGVPASRNSKPNEIFTETETVIESLVTSQNTVFTLFR